MYIGSYKNNVMYVLRLVKKISIKNILVLFVRYTIHIHTGGPQLSGPQLLGSSKYRKNFLGSNRVKNSGIIRILEKNLIIGILIDKSQYLRLISVLKWTWNSQYHNFLILLEAIILIIEEPLYYQTTLREHTLAFRGKSFYAVIIILW